SSSSRWPGGRGRGGQSVLTAVVLYSIMRATPPRSTGRSSTAASGAGPVHRLSLQNIEKFPSLRRGLGEVEAAVPSGSSSKNENGAKDGVTERKKRALSYASCGTSTRGSLTMMANQLERLEAGEPDDVLR
ncbi:unnamed protein product, partial [Laminaria digitata]